MAKICCSIELEPRTLRGGQLNHAREIALGIIEKNQPKEASGMFAQGLKPVSSIKEMVKMVQEIETLNLVPDHGDAEEEHNNVSNNNNNNVSLQTATCQCSCTDSGVLDDSPDQSQPKEPLSAPF